MSESHESDAQAKAEIEALIGEQIAEIWKSVKAWETKFGGLARMAQEIGVLEKRFQALKEEERKLESARALDSFEEVLADLRDEYFERPRDLRKISKDPTEHVLHRVAASLLLTRMALEQAASISTKTTIMGLRSAVI